MFDFIRTTNNQLKAIDAGQYAAGNGAAHEAVKEVVGRNNFANVLISDPTGKMASMMGGPAGGPINFGPEILSKANEVAQMQPASMWLWNSQSWIFRSHQKKVGWTIFAILFERGYLWALG